MARPLHIEYPGAVYHITNRGNDKKAVFKDDQDRETFLKILAFVNKRYHWLCHAYCLMDNHYHLMIETPDGNLSLGMRQLNGVYTQARNKRYNKTGHLFQGRYKSILIQKDSHLLEVCRYVVLNPVKASWGQVHTVGVPSEGPHTLAGASPAMAKSQSHVAGWQEVRVTLPFEAHRQSPL